MQPGQTVRRRSLGQRILLILAVLITAMLLLALFRFGVGGGAPAFHATTYDPPEPAAEFTLTDHTGAARSMSDFRGQPVFLFFGFTHCPDICPLTLQALSASLDRAGSSAEGAKVLLVTVDPDRDTPEVLARYVQAFSADIVGMTGDADSIREILSAYGAYSEPGQEHPDVLAHTTIIYGIDSAGMIRALLRTDAPDEQFQDDVETLLRL